MDFFGFFLAKAEFLVEWCFMNAFLVRWLITTLSVYVAAMLVPGIQIEHATSLIGACLLLGIINAFIRPILLILCLPFILVTMGVFIFVINALLLMFVSSLVPNFHVNGFWSAFFGSIIISIVSWALSSIFRTSDGKMHVITHHGQIKQARATMKQANARVVED